MKVYMVTSGCYSDYGVDGIFSSKELAEKFMYIGGYQRYNDIQEIELDDLELLSVGKDYEIGPVFFCRIYLESGALEEMTGFNQSKQYRHPESCKVISFYEPTDYKGWDGKNHHYDGYIIITSPINIEHAQKVAIENRQEWLRTKEIKNGRNNLE